jgi:hypothetical protein
VLHISLGGGGTLSVLPSARTAFPAAPSSHIPAGKTLSAGRKKSRRLGAISGSNGWLALRRLRQSHLFGGGYLDMLRSNSSEQLLSQRCRRCQLSFKDLCTVWPSGLVMRARSRARRRSCGTVARWDRLHRVYGPGGASVRPRRRVATRVSIVSGIEKKDDLLVSVGIVSPGSIHVLAAHAAAAAIFLVRRVRARSLPRLHVHERGRRCVLSAFWYASFLCAPFEPLSHRPCVSR